MKPETIKQELAKLKVRVKRLESQLPPTQKGRWREAIGFAQNDDLFDEAMRLGAEWRAQANRAGQ